MCIEPPFPLAQPLRLPVIKYTLLVNSYDYEMVHLHVIKMLVQKNQTK